jgi:hypothetical protein
LVDDLAERDFFLSTSFSLESDGFVSSVNIIEIVADRMTADDPGAGNLRITLADVTPLNVDVSGDLDPAFDAMDSF